MRKVAFRSSGVRSGEAGRVPRVGWVVMMLMTTGSLDYQNYLTHFGFGLREFQRDLRDARRIVANTLVVSKMRGGRVVATGPGGRPFRAVKRTAPLKHATCCNEQRYEVRDFRAVRRARLTLGAHNASMVIKYDQKEADA